MVGTVAVFALGREQAMTADFQSNELARLMACLQRIPPLQLLKLGCQAVALQAVATCARTRHDQSKADRPAAIPAVAAAATVTPRQPPMLMVCVR